MMTISKAAIADSLREVAELLIKASRTAAKQVVAFHGTTNGDNDAILHSILKKGLDPGAKKAWAEDDAAKETGSRSRASYGGIYFAVNPRTAFSSVRRAIEKLGGSYPVIITALIQPRSALPDEDDYTGMVDGAIDFAAQANVNTWLAAYYYMQTLLGVPLTKERDRFHEYIEKRLARSRSWPSKHNDQALLRATLDRLFDAEIRRRVSHLSSSDFNDYKKYVTQRALDELNLSEVAELPKEELKVPPSPVEAEAELRSALDALTRATKRHAVASEDFEVPDAMPRFNHTFRLMQPLTYHGRNRITSVVSLPNYNTRNSGDVVKVVSHYGDPAPVVAYLKEQGYTNIEVERAY